MNVLVIFMTMGVAANTPPNYLGIDASAGEALGGTLVTPYANGTFPAIQTSAGLPPSTAGFTGALVGLVSSTFRCWQVSQIAADPTNDRCKRFTLTAELCCLSNSWPKCESQETFGRE